MSAQKSIGYEVLDALRAARANACGEKLNDDQIAMVIEGTLREHGFTKARKRVAGRDALFDALAASCGYNPLEVTRMAGASIGVALADIASVTPNLSPEEFAARAARYKKLHPDWELTPTALATHWPELGVGDMGPTNASLFTKAPEGWKECLEGMARQRGWEQSAIDVMTSRGWAGLSLEYRQKIISQLNQSQ